MVNGACVLSYQKESDAEKARKKWLETKKFQSVKIQKGTMSHKWDCLTDKSI